MRPSLSIKSLLRTPVKTTVIFLLLAAVSAALFSRVCEYAVTSRELKRVAESYRGVGAVERYAPVRTDFTFDGALMLDERIPDTLILSEGESYDYVIAGRYAPLSSAETEAISALPYIERASTRYMGAGVSEDGFLRMNTNHNYYNYTHRFVIEGTVIRFWRGRNFSDFPDVQSHVIYMSDLKVLAGKPEILANVAHYFPFNLMVLSFPAEQTENPYGIVFKHSGLLSDAIILPEFAHDFTKSLKSGERYIFTAAFNPARWLETAVFTGDRAMQSQWKSIYPAALSQTDFLENDDFAALRDLIALIEDDRHTFDMVYTDDMRAITRFHEDDMRIVEGRMLIPSDSENSAAVCVVSKRFLSENKLVLGDIITFRLGDSLHSQNAALGAVSVISERRADNEETVKLEIVGVYDNFDSLRAQTDNPFWNYSNDTVFLPLSLLPKTADIKSVQIRPGEFSFIVNAGDISAFLDESAPVIEAMGLTLLFSDGGWLALEARFDVTGKLSAISILGISAASFMTLALVVFLFVERKRKDFAIMRALGVPKRQANYALLLPLLTLGLSAVICGGVAGFVYSGHMALNSLDTLIQSGIEVNTAVPVSAAVVCAFAETAALFVLVFAGLLRLGLKPPLVLLQGGAGKTAGSGKSKQIQPPKHFEAAPEIASDTYTTVMPLPDFFTPAGKYGNFSFMNRHIFLRSRRALNKTILALMLAAIFSGAIGQFAIMRHSYEDMYESMEVKGVFTNGLTLGNALQVAEKDFTKNPYYERVEEDAEVNGLGARMCMTSDLMRFVGGNAGVSDVSVEYAPGFDESFLVGQDTYCVLGSDLMDKLGVSFGDEVQVYLAGVKSQLRANNPTIDEMIFDAMLRRGSTFYTVAGRLEGGDSVYADSVFVPVNHAPMPMYRSAMQNNIRLSYVEFTLADNAAADEFRDYAKWILGALDGGRSFVLDTSELESVTSSMNLWNALFPVVCAALIITGGLLPGLMIIGCVKDAALFRILGTTKKHVRIILISEQIMLCLPGILLGLTAVRLYNGSQLFGAVSSIVLPCTAVYFAVCAVTSGFCAFNVTKHKVLDLLQSRE
ncbi:MAG: hypothetical protein FWG70_01970 [Oscillospiraceae bacterium]|nr:hypothetical protein [Oscillospiraceae bacterium]